MVAKSSRRVIRPKAAVTRRSNRSLGCSNSISSSSPLSSASSPSSSTILFAASAACIIAAGADSAGTTSLEAPETTESRTQRNQGEPIDILENKYIITNEVLGIGAFGKVYKAFRKSDGMPVAIKEIRRSDEANQSEFEHEIAALSELSQNGGHPNICRLFDCFRTADVNYVVMEIIDGGEVLEHLIRGGPYNEVTASKYVRELAEGLAYMHSHNIIHSDLKCENLMLSSWDESKTELKIVDFGTSVTTADACKGLDGDIDDFKGTAAYCSPERLRDDTGCPSKSDDMWAIGAIVFILLTGPHPFDAQGDLFDEDIEEVILSISPDEAGVARFREIVLDRRVDKLSESSKELIQQLMHPDPKQRLKASELLGNQWVQGLSASWEKLEDSDRRLKTYWQNTLRAAIMRKFAKKEADGSPVVLSDANLHQIFNSIDLNGDNVLSAQELRVALRQLGITDTEASMMIASADLDRSGCVDFSEFKQLLRQTFSEGPDIRISNKKLIKTAMLTAMSSEGVCGAEMSEQQIIRVFQAIDKDGDGYLSEDELKVFLKRFGLDPAVISKFIAEAGGDRGILTLDSDAFRRLCKEIFHRDQSIPIEEIK